MRLLLASLVSFCLIPLVACSSSSDEVACTTIAAISVTVDVVDATGAAVTDADLTYTVNGGPSKACEQVVENSYDCGVEEAGNFVITATRDMATKTANVTVTSDECHVIGQTLTITLD
ncbi:MULTISPECIES: hypothetical protein [Polyangium]|uniref:Carboxypeptidase regulatory-like domain-containing protein n=2 Tax=Polyangium TaxID=55 RepID=A0A4U1ISB9_9BACT|nr:MULTISPECIES: hypothetical protein [Polyangium]MDI1435626.1 hypothetical protein [Polyangium sorediatum]TKC97146.1 hypothetical protein E8A74_44360 [Polyangium fumosum]